jgi:hypothetical protein
MKRRVLIVSPHFPPVNAPDMQRVRMSLPHFVTAGWEVTVLTVADPTPTAPLDPELNATLPASVQVIRAHCFSRGWTRWLGVNNVALRSLPFLFLSGCRLLAGKRFDVVYFSTTMFIVLPLGRLWRWLYGTPYVVDFQDPWVTDYYARPGAPPPPGGWKYRFAQGLAVLLEGWSLRHVAQLISVSPLYIVDLRKRHPWLHDRPCTVLPFGSPEIDLQYLRATLHQRPGLLPPGQLRLAYAGALGPGMLSSVELLFAALAGRKDDRITVHFFGTTYSHHRDLEAATLKLARQYGVTTCVHESPGRLRYFDALQVTLEAEVNVLLGSEELSFIPSKLLAVLAAGRPVLAIAPVGSVLLERLAATHAARVSFSPAGPQEPARGEILAVFEELLSGRIPPIGPSAAETESVDSLASRQLAILESTAHAAQTR